MTIQLPKLALIYLVIECNLGALLVHIDILEECSVGAVCLLLDRGSKLHQVVGDGLICGPEDVDQFSRVRLIVLCKQGDGDTRLAGTSSTSDPVDVIFDGQRELYHTLINGTLSKQWGADPNLQSH